MHPFIYRAPCTATAEMDQLDDSQPCRTSPHAAALRFLLFLVFPIIQKIRDLRIHVKIRKLRHTLKIRKKLR